MRFSILLSILFASSAAFAQTQSPDAARPETKLADYYFPGSGKIAVTASTGFPFMAGGEVAVGLGSRFAIGARAAGGPFPGSIVFSLAPRVDLVHLGPMRLVLDSPMLWYPGITTGDNWFIWRPSLRIEGLAGRVRVHGSVGAIVAWMAGSASSGPIAPYGGGDGLPSGVQQGSAWNEWAAGVAVALSARTSIFLDAFAITRGFEAAGAEWFHLPAGGNFGITTTL